MGKESKNKKTRKELLFQDRNYKLMGIGLLVIAIGFILMAGGGSDDPNVFNPEIFAWRRIRLAPTLVLIGLAVQAYAILTPPKKK